jgi:hypothetical protein
VRNIAYRAGWAALAMTGLALVAGAQGPPALGGFGGRGPGFGGPPGGPMDGAFEFGGMMRGFGGKTVTGKPFQATFTITRTETLPGNSITNTTTGVIARDTDGSTYRDVKLPAIGSLAISGQSPEFISIRNLSQLMEYVENVSKKTYEAFAIRAHTPPPVNPDGQGRGPHGLGSNNESVSDTKSTYTDPVKHTVYKVDDKKVTRTIPAGQIGNQFDIVTTTERLYSADLDVVLQLTRSDPRFGNSTYQLSDIGQPTSSSLFLPDPSFQLVQGHGKFGHGGHRGAGQPPPPPPQD